MLDPILMSPKDAIKDTKMAPGIRRQGDLGDQRPASACDLEQKRSKGRPCTPTSVAETRGHVIRSERIYEHLDKRREENFYEHVKFENAVLKAKWRPPEWDGETLEQVPPHEFGWLGEPMEEDAEPGTRAEETMMAKRLARKILFGIERNIRERHTTFSKLFNNEEVANVGNVLPKGTLEVKDFLSGLTRIGVLDGGSGTTSHELLTQAMQVIDSAFDGHGMVDLRSVSRGVTAARTIRTESIRSKRRDEGVQRRPFSASSAPPKSQSATLLPRPAGHFDFQRTPDPPGKSSTSGARYQDIGAEPVKVDKNPRSVFDFESSFKKFKEQQRTLLEHGGYLKV
jgi:hypothetical protein